MIDKGKQVAGVALEASAADVDFVATAASSNSLELEASKLALERSKNTAVRDFAQHMVAEHGKVVAGCMANDGEQGVPDAWTIYLSTDDADRTAEAAKANGGQVINGPMQVPGGSWIINGIDPQGAMFALVAPKK